MVDVDVTPEQCRAARAILGWTRADLAQAARISVNTVSHFENKKVTTNLTADAISRALKRAGIVPNRTGGIDRLNS